MTHPNILLTGIPGNAASRIAPNLLAAGIQFRAASRQDTPELANQGVEVVRMDFSDGKTVAAALQGIELVYLITPLAPESTRMVEDFIAAAQSAGVRHIIRQSANGADPSSDWAFARLHGEQEQLIQDSGLDWTILRPNSFVQNLGGTVQPVLEQGTLYSPSAPDERTGERGSKIAYTDLDDLAAVGAKIIEEPKRFAGQTLTITGPAALTAADVAAAFTRALGRPVQAVPVDEAQFRQMLGGLPSWLVNAIWEIELSNRAGHASQPTTDVDDVLGRKARSIDDWVSTVVSTPEP